MPIDISITGARAGVNIALTNLAQGFVQPSYVMRLLYPLDEVATYGGTVLQFDDSMYDDVSDDRGDDTPYPEIQSGYEGKPFKLNTKGLSYRVPDKRRKEMENLRINWGNLASNSLMTRAGLRHEIEGAVKATTVANYAATNRITLSAGNRFGDANVDPDLIIRTGKDSCADQIGVEPNVSVIGRRVFSALANKYARTFTAVGTNPGIRPQLTLMALAQMYGFRKVAVCDAIVKVGGARTKVFGNHMVMAYTNPAALPTDDVSEGLLIPFRPSGAIDVMTPAYGYTYSFEGNPLMYSPYYDNDRGATVYKLDFDRQVVNSGVNDAGLITHGYLIRDAA
ncbi:MAG: hypothetical protein HC781_06410 [Leptolyngbyaceae cyanobacterium CSU_1_4]|nr:hypothetical protein [Leptolyngbyaceae cyanobacterium CSU_1_4]